MRENYVVPDPDHLTEMGRELNAAGVHDWFTVNEDGVENVEVWACERSDHHIREEAEKAGYLLEPIEVLVNIRYRVYKKA